MAVTIHDIARELNVSSMTVSRVLSSVDNTLVKPATRIRVEEAALRMGYRPNRNARALASGRTNIIGLWISHLNTSVYSQIAQACRVAVQEAGMEISISEMDWHFHASEGHRRFQWPVDGILAVDPPPQDVLEKLLEPTAWKDVPRVHLGSGQSVPWQGDSVCVDLGAGTRTAIEHLLRVGCKRIAYVTPWWGERPGMCHYDAYIEVLKTVGMQPECIVVDDWECPTVRRTVVEHIKANGHPDGIYCHHDEFTIATFRALRDLDLHIPNDVALIGCEGNAFLEYFDPSISTMAMPVPDLCRTSWELLQKRINEPLSPPQNITLPVEFLARASSR
ncbi:catabolite control protein A [Abditibacteriota bacterium]|nr:catabolite control protein A [Abditibacteriota bacterium]